MVERVTHCIGHGLRPLLELLPIRRIARAVALGNAIRAHSTPLIVVARKPDFREVAELMVRSYIFGVEVTMVVDDRHLSCVVVVKTLCRRALQQEIGVVKLFHGQKVLVFI